MTRLIAALGCALVLCPAFPADPANKEAAEFFEQRVRPVLAKHCFACHTGSRLGGLRMDSREDILKGGNNGPALVPGNPDQSLLVQAVRRTHERFKMPPTGQLAAEEVTSLERWVKAGAIWPESPAPPPSKSAQYVITPEQQAFWSFQPVKKPALPAVRNSAWAKSPVDRFVLAKLEAGGLRPARPASRRALLRRVAFGLTGLPPTADEIEAFEKDASPEAFAKVVDRLLASPHYGERWGRHWLDLARYADGQLGASRDTPYPNAFRYRDWVIGAFNQDLPYDLFVKAQIAADLLDRPDREKLLAGLGFQALGGRGDDQVDVTTRAFLALTAGCAQCHDHKYDPIPTRDYYSLLGVFRSSEPQEFPLAPESEVAAYQNHKRKIEQLEEAIDDFVRKRSEELSAILAGKTAQYLVAARQLQQGGPAPAHLDKQILERWVTYLKEPKKEHPFLRKWYELKSGEDVRAFASQFQDQLVSIFEEKREIDDRNYVKMGGAKGVRTELIRQYTNIESLEVDKYYLWRDMASEPFMRNGMLFRGGVYYYGLTNGMRRDFEVRGGEAPVVDDVEPYLGAEWKEHLARMRAEAAALSKTLPPQYPFLHALKDAAQPANARVAIRGDAQNLGEEAPRGFLQILGGRPFSRGSGRLELAEAIASPANPLTARVMVNRIWQWHFGEGIVRSPGNFGQLGERPTHPELLDYLAARFLEQGWSIKKLQREILLSSTYALSTGHDPANHARDPENKLLWRANLRQRLDAEALRDSLLAVSGRLDRTMGGPAAPLDENNRRRTVYGYVGRTTLDPMLALFDFPNPNNTSERRTVTVGPMQRLYFMNNAFVAAQANALAGQVERRQAAEPARIRELYRAALGRFPDEREIGWGREFLRSASAPGAWAQYAQALLGSAEFSTIH